MFLDHGRDAVKYTHQSQQDGEENQATQADEQDQLHSTELEPAQALPGLESRMLTKAQAG